MTLPLLASVPHAGLRVPPEAEPYCVLTPEQIAADGDVGAATVYAIESEVQAYVTTDIARAIVDQNRATDDRRKDGVVKTHTCWDEPVYDPFPPEAVLDQLLTRYYHPYHRRLRELAASGVRLGLDLHTMAAAGPPVGPDPGVVRPAACLSNADGTCPEAWIQAMRTAFAETVGGEVRINDPFRGGYITRTHSGELPWMQVELSRGPFLSDEDKRRAVLQALSLWCERVL